MPVSRDDIFCGRCGADLRRRSYATSPTVTPPRPPEMPPAPPPPPPYERKYGLVSRLTHILYKPTETMKDIALAPDYIGVMVILIAQVFIGIVSVAYVLSRVTITGPSAGFVQGIMSIVIVLTFVFTFILTPVKWLVKSALVWKLGDAGSSWAFKSAASVTGYAYMANLIISLVTLPISIYVFPTMQIDTSNLEAAMQMMATYQSQFAALKFTYTIPALLLAVLWKSYLGALGTNYGTKQMCRIASAFILFFLLGSITIVISLFT
jgi:hypothetical protein